MRLRHRVTVFCCIHAAGTSLYAPSTAASCISLKEVASHLGAPGAFTLSATNHHHFSLLKARRAPASLSSRLCCPPRRLQVCSSASTAPRRLVITALWWSNCSGLPSRKRSTSNCSSGFDLRQQLHRLHFCVQTTPKARLTF